MNFQRATWLLSLLGLAGLAMAAGCGSEDNGLAAISGRVTFQQQPLDCGAIEFFSTSSNGARVGGAMILDGSFDMPKALSTCYGFAA